MEELLADVLPERPEARVQVGDPRAREVARQRADEPLRRRPQQLDRSLLAGAGPDDVVEAVHLIE